MNIEKLFGVLVLGGAAVGLGACGDANSGGDSAGETSSSGGAGGSASTGSGGAGGSASTGSGGAGGSASTGSGGSGLECTTPFDPADPCGCPCCWADNCLNNEPCCAGFCSAGNNGAGCCGG